MHFQDLKQEAQIEHVIRMVIMILTQDIHVTNSFSFCVNTI